MHEQMRLTKRTLQSSSTPWYPWNTQHTSLYKKCAVPTFDPTSLASNKNRKANGFVLYAHHRHSIGFLWPYLKLNHGVARISLWYHDGMMGPPVWPWHLMEGCLYRDISINCGVYRDQLSLVLLRPVDHSRPSLSLFSWGVFFSLQIERAACN